METIGNAKRRSRTPKRVFHGNQFGREGSASAQEEQAVADHEEEAIATRSSSSEKYFLIARFEFFDLECGHGQQLRVRERCR